MKKNAEALQFGNMELTDVAKWVRVGLCTLPNIAGLNVKDLALSYIQVITDMDQALSLKNLKLLLKQDREKGGNLEEQYIPDAFLIRMKLYRAKKLKSFFRYKFRIGKVSERAYEIRVSRLNTVIKGREEQHNNFIDAELEKISKAICKKDFRISVNLLPTLIGGKKVYGVGHSLDQILAVRFIQKTLKHIHEIKMPPRDILVSQIKSLVLDEMPKFIIRADIEQFYESVRHKELVDGIHQTPDLSIDAKRILTRLIKDYVAASGDDKGLPRGIGISAYLSEIYLASIDREIKKHPDVFYYSRYVDDMVVMYAPKRRDAIGLYMPSLENLFNEKGLVFNAKTSFLDLVDEQKGSFEYLGYEFDVSPGKRGVRLSLKKMKKYRERIDKSFNDYDSKKNFIKNKASSEIISRILFLTGNIRLFNRKSNAFIGVYFGNKFITDTGQLRGLDKYLESKIGKLTDPALVRRLRKMSFVSGFEEKIFRNFTPDQLSEISRGWKHG